MKKFLLLLLVCALFTGCGNDTTSNALKIGTIKYINKIDDMILTVPYFSDEIVHVKLKK